MQVINAGFVHHRAEGEGMPVLVDSRRDNRYWEAAIHGCYVTRATLLPVCSRHHVHEGRSVAGRYLTPAKGLRMSQSY